MPKGEHRRKLSDDQRDEAVRLYTTRNADGTWTGTTTIARMMGVRHYTIQSLLKKRGVAMRDARESHDAGKRCRPIKNLPTGDPPACKCGCGEPVPWNRRRNHWYMRVPGHRQPPPAARGRSRARSGAANAAWKGGVTPLRQKLYKSEAWRAAVRETLRRDGYVCQRCGAAKTGGRKLHAHHVASFAEHADLRLDVANLVTLCGACHRWVHSRNNAAREFIA